jgi:hypothetical protein
MAFLRVISGASGSQTNPAAILSCYTTDRPRADGVEQDHRRIKRRIQSMLGFKAQKTADPIVSGVELVHMMRKTPGEGRLQSKFRQWPSSSLLWLYEIFSPPVIPATLKNFATERIAQERGVQPSQS